MSATASMPDEKPRKSTPGHGGYRPGAGRKPKSEQNDAYLLLAKAKAKREMYNAQLAELEYREKSGELIPFDLLNRILSAAFVDIRASLLSQHNTIASQFPEIPPDAIRWILESNRSVLAKLAKTRLPESVGAALDALAEPHGTATGSDGKPMG